jgi:hypothetical protein
MSSNTDNRFAIESVYGTWYMNYSEERKRSSWFLQRDCGNKYGWGRQLVFDDSGEFVDTVSDKCGSSFHYWLGMWKWNKDDQTLFIQIKEAGGGIDPGMEPSEDYMKGVTLYFKEESKGKILLMPLNRGIELENDIIGE